MVLQNFDLNQVIIEAVSIADEVQICSFFELMIIETFKQNDVWELQELLREEIEEKCRFLHEALMTPSSQRHFLVAKHGGHVVGTIASGPANKDIVEGSRGTCTGWLEIGTVFVHTDYQCLGLGSKMIDEMEKWLMSRGVFQYSLDSGYKLAQRTWTKKYGEPTYLLKDHWGEGADHMIWTVSLRGKRVRLWTRQDIRSLDELKSNGVIRTQPAYLKEKFEEISPYILKLYDWFVTAAHQRVPKPESVTYPIWCSVSEENMLRPTPSEVVYVLEVEPSEIIYFDGAKWDMVLNHLYIPRDRNDAKRYAASMEAKGFKHGFSFIDSKTAHFYPIERQEVMASWYRIFDIEEWSIFTVQANIWEIRQDMIKNIFFG